MNRVVERKLFFAWGLEKEKAYLESKAKEGYHLVEVAFGRYVFEKGEPKDVVYQFDFQILNKNKEQEYLEIFEEWELVQRYGSWYYFRKDKTEDCNEIYSDVDSLKKMFLRLLGFLALTGFPLYYQILIMFPYLESEAPLSTFYLIFRPIVYILAGIHLFALVRVFMVLTSLQKSIRQ